MRILELTTMAILAGFVLASTAEAAPPHVRRARHALDDAADLAKRGSNCQKFITSQARFLADDLTEQSLTRSLRKLDELEGAASALCPFNVRVMLRQARGYLLSYQVSRGWTPLWTWNTVENAQRSCDRGYAEACFVLGERYETGRQVKKNLSLAAKLYEKSCESRWAKACTALGLLERGGKGVDKNAEAAVGHFKEACTAKDAKGCYYFGLHLESGEGIMANPIDAKKYFKRACKGKYKKACAKTKDPTRIGTPPGGEKYNTEITL